MNDRYKAGWLVPGQVLALTHFVPDVSPDDFMGIANDTAAALQAVEQPFHLIIDNRIITNNDLASLEMMLTALPLIDHPQLRWIVMVVPKALAGTAQDMNIQHHGLIGLKHVDTLEEAFAFLSLGDNSLDWTIRDTGFFMPG